MIKKLKSNNRKGFTLIELLVTISIIMVLSTIALFSVNNARESARNAKRKADLENIRTAFELFYSDCGRYPPPGAGNTVRSPVQSSDAGVPTVNCPAAPSNIYMSNVPEDPAGGTAFYYYNRPTISSFVLCTHIEGSTDPTPSGCPAGATGCGDGPCNHSIAGP